MFKKIILSEEKDSISTMGHSNPFLKTVIHNKMLRHTVIAMVKKDKATNSF